MTILINYDLESFDFIETKLPNYIHCCELCLSYAERVAYIWDLPEAGSAAYTCFLKNVIPSMTAYSALVSAYR
jgi:hypothetical protein